MPEEAHRPSTEHEPRMAREGADRPYEDDPYRRKWKRSLEDIIVDAANMQDALGILRQIETLGVRKNAERDLSSGPGIASADEHTIRDLLTVASRILHEKSDMPNEDRESHISAEDRESHVRVSHVRAREERSRSVLGWLGDQFKLLASTAIERQRNASLRRLEELTSMLDRMMLAQAGKTAESHDANAEDSSVVSLLRRLRQLESALKMDSVSRFMESPGTSVSLRSPSLANSERDIADAEALWASTADTWDNVTTSLSSLEKRLTQLNATLLGESKV